MSEIAPSSKLPAQRLSYCFSRQYQVRDGLPGAHIKGLYRDESGLVWIASLDGGVCRFDGIHFDHLPSLASVPAAPVCIKIHAEDLWVGTLHDGVFLYKDFTLQTTYSRIDGLPSNEIVSLNADIDGSILVGTQEGLGQISGGECLTAMVQIEGSPIGAIYDIAIDATGSVWLATSEHGLVHMASGLRIHSPQEEDEAILRAAYKLALDGGGGLWIAPKFNGDKLRLLHYNPLQKCFARSADENAIFAPPCPTAEIHHLRVDCDDRVWLACGDVYVYHDQKWSSFRPRLSPTNLGDINLTYEDDRGNIWLGTVDAGLSVCSPGLVQYYGGEDGIPEAIYGLAEDEEGHILLHVGRGQIRLTDAATPLAACHVEDSPQAPSLTSHWRQIKGWWAGQLHATSLPQEGLCIEGPQGRPFLLQEDQLQTILNAAPLPPSALLQDFNGRIWVSWDIEVNALQYYEDGRMHVPQTSDGEQMRFVTALCQDREGTLWIGTRTGLFTQKAQGAISRPRELAEIQGTHINSLANDAEGAIWIGCNNGMGRYDGTALYMAWSETEWLRHGVTHILRDRRGRTWAATHSGLVSYTMGAAPRVRIRQIAAGQPPTYPLRRAVDIAHETLEVRVSFQGIDFKIGPRSFVYSYRLLSDGDEVAWSHWSTTAEATFSGLSPGQYKFEVRSANLDGISPAARATIAVRPNNAMMINEALTQHLLVSDDSLMAESDSMAPVLQQASQVAATDLTVLVTGETGTGKGLLARHIHQLSNRAGNPFIALNCGAISEGLITSELFGHEKGAFTGAVSRKMGHFELANGGTLFLDEIGDLPLDSQRALLHILEECMLTRVGGTKAIPVDVRVIAATHRDLESNIKSGTFREDLFFRLSIFDIALPPLRERRVDIPLLIQFFIEKFARQFNLSKPIIADSALRLLEEYDWPGNIRELENVIQRAVLVCENGEIRSHHLTVLKAMPPTVTDDLPQATTQQGHESSATDEKQRIKSALEETQWVIYGNRGAAKKLGMHPEKLRSRMRKYGFKKDPSRYKQRPQSDQK